MRVPVVTCAVAGVFLAAVVLDAQVFRAEVEGVVVDALVTRGNRPVPDLTAADFRLCDNGVEQRITSVELEEVPISLMFVLDTSSSVEGELFEQLKAGTEAAVAALGPDDRVGLVAFSHRVQLLLPPSAEPSSMASAIGALEADGDTSLYDATFAQSRSGIGVLAAYCSWCSATVRTQQAGSTRETCLQPRNGATSSHTPS